MSIKGFIVAAFKIINRITQRFIIIMVVGDNSYNDSTKQTVTIRLCVKLCV